MAPRDLKMVQTPATRDRLYRGIVSTWGMAVDIPRMDPEHSMALPLDLFRPKRMVGGPYSPTNPGISNAFTGTRSIKPLASKATHVILNHFIVQSAGLLP